MKVILTILTIFIGLGENIASEPSGMVINVDAGESQTICYGETLNLDLLGASISGDVSDGLWFTMGDGIFLPGNGTNGIFSETDQYQPGIQDQNNGSFTLILVSDDPDGNGPMVEVSDEVEINFMNAPALVCNSSINVSLADGCEQEVDIFMLLANPTQPYDKYIIELYDENDDVVPDNILTVEHLGTNVTFTVGHSCTNNTCGGEIAVSDNIAPFLNCTDTEIECEFGISPETIGFPIPFYASATAIDENTFLVVDLDACGDVTLTYQDVEIEMVCASTGYIKEITRSWTAEDESGNNSSCSQIILVNPLPLSIVISPPNYDGTDEEPLSCDGDWETLPDGHPSPASTGMPAFPDCGNIDATYTDVEFDECGSGFKVVRQWFVIDWCTTESFNENQIIKILDQAGPIFECPEDLTLSSQAYDCASVSHPLVFAENVYDCSAYNYSFKILTLDDVDITSEYIDENNTLVGPPVGEYQLLYIATDVCGNASQCITILNVIDDTAPFAICEGYTQVALGSNGIAELWASSVDDGSFDNCGNITMEIAKITDECGWGLDFNSKADFCCEEVGNTIMVAFKVTDDQGLSNTCTVSVFVEDNLPPMIECPTNLIISCSFSFDPEDLSVFGSVVEGEGNGSPIIINSQTVGMDGYFEDNCEASVQEESSYDLNCGTGTITRIFTATDLYGQTASCTQTITIENNSPFLENDITWPSNFEMNGCDTIQADPSVTGEPTWIDDKCDLVAATYVDQYFFISGSACIKVLREWTVIDWCQFEVGQSEGIWTYLQEIKLKNNIAPAFIECKDQDICSYDENCTSEFVTITAYANDDCTDSLDLLYLWNLDIDDDGTIDDSGQGIEFSRDFLYGEHRVFWIIEDGCGNSSSCNYKLTVRDCKNPTPYCNSSITTTIMPSAGMIQIWAQDYDFGSYDNCTEPEDLIFSFSQDINDDNRIITCDDIVNGVAHEFTFEFWVTDENGNQERCDVKFIVQDNADVCLNGTIKGKIEGRVFSQYNKYISDVELNYTASINTFSGMKITDSLGVFELEATPEYLKYVFRPHFESDPNTGVSTLDLVMIQRHILEINQFDNPYDIIASDVTGNDKVSSADLLTLRKMILGIISEWPQGTENWVFVDSSFVFPDETYPWIYPDSIVVEALLDTVDEVNFVAIKMGDVNGSYKSAFRANNSKIGVRSDDQVNATISKQSTSRYSSQYDIVFEDIDEMADGLQFSLRIPDDAQVVSDYINEADYFIEDNILKVSWVNTHLEDIENTPLLSIIISDLEDKITVVQDLSPEIYLDLIPHVITFNEDKTNSTDESQSDNTHQLISVVQNPFISDLELILLEEGQVQLDVFNTQGIHIFSQSAYNKSEVQIEGKHFEMPGLYILSASKDGIVQTVKVIKI